MTKAQATQLGINMVARLGKGWTLTVTENIEWQARSYSPTKHICVLVHVSGNSEKPTYSCVMTEDPEMFLNCGLPLWTENRPYKIYSDPVEAVIDQVNYAREKVNALDWAVRAAEETIADFTCPCCGKSRAASFHLTNPPGVL